MPVDPDSHHRRSIRLPEYDYAQEGAYFVTICTYGRRCLFGEVVDDAMRLNAVGRIAAACWQGIPAHFPHVWLDAFIVMPNHLHGIIVIDRPIEKPVDPATSGQPIVGARHAVPLQARMTEAFGQPVAGSLPTIIRSYKSAVTRRANRLDDGPAPLLWQRNYYEHVIRSTESYAAICAYIHDNPARWAADQDNPANL